MNIDQIEKIIRLDVCGVCPALGGDNCPAHIDRCYAAYHRQAEKIHAAMPPDQSARITMDR